jgi:hypothetical protein
MSVIHFHPHSAVCPECGRETGNIARHEPICRRKRAEAMAGELPLSPEERRLVERACAHAVFEELLEPERRFANGVTDLDVARLLKVLESGGVVVQGGRSGWTVPTGSPLHKGGLAKTVQETIRLGLVTALSEPVGPQIRRVYLVPADVHLRSPWDNLSPACASTAKGLKRHRLVRNRQWVDCRACLESAT